MGKVLEALTDELTNFIEKQHLFFVASAPKAGGHINLSPKGLDSFAVLDTNRVAYLDFVGSGAETIAHLRENGRIVVMFCAFTGSPRILRLYGRGRVVSKAAPDFAQLRGTFGPAKAAVRSIILIDLDRVSTSCGYAIPRMRFEGHRDQLELWADRKDEAGVREFQAQHNRRSIDGLPALGSEEI